MDSALALFALLAWCVSAWGWGRLVLRACGIEAQRGVAYATVLGLAALAGVGGWLNLLGIALPPALWALLAVGWFAAARPLSTARLPAFLGTRTAAIAALPALAAGAATVFLAFALLPSAVFNPMDDLQLYFYRPVRMLQAGTLGHDPFDSLGFDSLGIQAFLQAFTLLAFAPQFLNAFDAVLCAALALLLVADTARILRIHVAAAMAAVAGLALLHPQQGNISAVYSTAAFCLALPPAAFPLIQHGVPSGSSLWRRALPLGLLVAAIVGLKSTTLSFVLPAALAFFALLAVLESAGAALRAAGAIGAWCAIFLLPWIGLHVANYFRWHGGGHDGDGIGYGGNPTALLNDADLFWGGSMAAYNVVAAIVLAAALAGTIAYLRRQNRIERWQLVPLLALCWGAAGAYILNTFPFEPSHAVRYSIPVLLVGVSAAALLIAMLIPRCGGALLALAVPAVIGVAFATAIANRVQIQLPSRTTLSLPEGAVRDFGRYTDWALSADAALWVRKAQARIPPGERILAVVALPHHLLFARNPLFVASDSGLAMPWLRLPIDADAATLRRFLQQHGIRHVIWQIGNGTKPDEQLQDQLAGTYPIERRQARAVLSLRKSLAMLTDASEVLHADDGLIAIRVADR